jgi:hypothetical protein
VEEEDKMAQPQQSTGEERTRGDQVVLSDRDNSTMQSEHTVQKNPQYWYHAFRSPRL